MYQFGLLMVQACRRTCTIKQGNGTEGLGGRPLLYPGYSVLVAGCGEYFVLI